MWALLGNLFFSSATSIVKELAEARVAHRNADTEEERIFQEERINHLNARRDVVLQAQRDKIERWVRIFWAFPFIVYTWKLLLWDKVLEWGATEPLSPTLEYMLWTILGGYFIDTMIKTYKRR